MNMKRILINAEQPNEVRVAYAEDGKLIDFEIESTDQQSIKNNIYIGVVSTVKNDLEGAFVDIGEERHGLLAFNRAGGRGSRDSRCPSADQPIEIERPDLHAGQHILVQVFREGRGEKGAALTMELSLPGRFIVLKPNSSARAVSRNVSEVQRMRLRELGDQLPNVENIGWIVRTTAVNHTPAEIISDFHRMMNLWRKIQHAFEENQSRGPLLVFSENTLMQRILRDRLRRDGTRVIIDNPSLYREARNFASDFMPELREQIEHYRSDRPLFDTFRIEKYVSNVFARKATLRSGGELVFDPTEALLSIDVNSARNTRGNTLEETALHTNLEAAEEICRQLMIRNIGGLIVVDFIDMLTEGYNEQVERAVQQYMAKDMAKIECSAISEFGLMQLNRQRRRPSIYDVYFEECTHCKGTRLVQRTETVANRALRKLSYLTHDPARHDNQYLCRVSEEIAAYILNKERQYLHDIELNTHKQIVVISDLTLAKDEIEITSRRIEKLDFKEGSNLEELIQETQQETNERARPAAPPDEPKPQRKPLVAPVDSKTVKKQQKGATHSPSSSPPTKQKRKQSKNKRQKHVNPIISLFSSLLGGGKTKKKKKSGKSHSSRGASKSKHSMSASSLTGKANTNEPQRRNPNARGRRGTSRTDGRDESKAQSTSSGQERTPSRRERMPQTKSSPKAVDPRTQRSGSHTKRRTADSNTRANTAAQSDQKHRESAVSNRRAPRSAHGPGGSRTQDPAVNGRRTSQPASRTDVRSKPTQSAYKEESTSARRRSRSSAIQEQRTSSEPSRRQPPSRRTGVDEHRREKQQRQPVKTSNASVAPKSNAKPPGQADETVTTPQVDRPKRPLAANDTRSSNRRVSPSRRNPPQREQSVEPAPSQTEPLSSQKAPSAVSTDNREGEKKSSQSRAHAVQKPQGPASPAKTKTHRAGNDPRSRS